MLLWAVGDVVILFLTESGNLVVFGLDVVDEVQCECTVVACQSRLLLLDLLESSLLCLAASMYNSEA